ncbi:DUF2637 domain-containing protein [Rhizomonospora bruguierae]|uniref:DUF2637 domain-containing protein n=1 Tax=Rhizomonospora bruguierae TaxID=1581705 RepID=UPI001BCDBFF3|nr:DUF2637 domain-containing protein [Micromonospora sp. NBRC 107566]
MPLKQLRRVRWAVRATLGLGVAASVVANILHAMDNPISQAIAAWPPLALLLTVELISRVPVHRRSLAYARIAATAVIAGIAAWVSYWHMAGVAARYGETGAAAYLLPLSVDGLIVVASICLVELGARIAAESQWQAAPKATPTPATGTAAAPATAATQPAAPAPATATTPESVPVMALASVAPTKRAPAPARRQGAGTKEKSKPPRRSPAETAALASAYVAAKPDATDAEVAKALGITTQRLRTVLRQTDVAAGTTAASPAAASPTTASASAANPTTASASAAGTTAPNRAALKRAVSERAALERAA